MSQDNPNSEPQSQTEPEASQSPPTRRRRIPPEQPPLRTFQPFWKAQTIKLLRGTIGLLQGAVVKLETPPPAKTQEIPNFWSGLLGKIRSLLPANLSAKLSNRVLTGIIAGITLVLIFASTTVLTSKSTEVTPLPPVAEVPAPTPTPIITTSPETAVPEPQPAEEIVPPAPMPTPTPTPAVELTPEQRLIAGIENQVAEISDRFASGLIKSIQANFRTSNLTVKISDDWHTLEKSEQAQLLAEILQRSQQLDFSHLEIIDSQDRLIARNPVVGSEMIIFQSQINSIKKPDSL